METRGRYIVIGAFTVLGFLGILGFLLWFGAAQATRQFAYYDVLFDNVSGITRSAEVRFAGLPVGQVQDLDLDREGSGKVRVRLEIDAQTPVRTGSVATLEAQGVTGTSIVSITPGRPQEPLLRDTVEGVPEIAAGRSALQNLSEAAPALLDEALRAVEGLNAILTPENRSRISSTIVNLEDASARLSTTLGHADAAMGNIDEAVSAISGLTTAVNEISGRAGTLIDSAEAALRDFASLREPAAGALEAGRTALAAAEEAIAADLKPALAELTQTSARLRETVDRVTPEAEALVGSWTETGRAASARLAEAEALIARLTESAAAVDPATLARVGDALDRMAADLPALTEDLRGAGSSAAEAFGSLSEMVARVEPPLDSFLRTGLPEFTRLGGDLRGLVRTLDGLAAGLRRGPAGAILQENRPEFRR